MKVLGLQQNCNQSFQGLSVVSKFDNNQFKGIKKFMSEDTNLFRKTVFRNTSLNDYSYLDKSLLPAIKKQEGNMNFDVVVTDGKTDREALFEFIDKTTGNKYETSVGLGLKQNTKGNVKTLFMDALERLPEMFEKLKNAPKELSKK